MNKRLLFLIHSLSMGGAERVLANLANYWSNKGYTVAVATLCDLKGDFYTLNPQIERIALDVAKPSHGLVSALANNLRILLAVRQLLQQWQPDATIALMTHANVYLALAGFNLPGQKIGSEHNHPPELPLGRNWENLRYWAYGRLDHLVALTEPSAAWLRENTCVKKVSVIGNPIPWPLPDHSPVIDPATVMRPNRKCLFAVGRLAEQKGFDLLVEAFAQLASVMPQWDLVIAGEGPLRAQLETQVERLGLKSRVILAGKVGNMGDWYAACALYVMSSRFEGFGNTLAEAKAYARPVISFDCDTGPSDIIRHGVDGVLVPNGDVEALVKSLKHLMCDESWRNELGAKAIEARERFSVERIAAKWEELFTVQADGK